MAERKTGGVGVATGSGTPYSKRAYREAKGRLRGLPCRWCGKPSNSVDHIVPLSRGGANSFENFAPACLECNTRKGGALGGKIRGRQRRHVERNRRY